MTDCDHTGVTSALAASLRIVLRFRGAEVQTAGIEERME